MNLMKKEPEIQQVPLTSPDERATRIDTLRRLFPDLFDGDGVLDEKALRTLLADEVPNVSERFRFEWAGKTQSKRFAFVPSKATLAFDPTRSLNADGSALDHEAPIEACTSGNLIIEADNLEALKLLSKSYFEQVKCIYIDPPYNKDADVIYPDDYSESADAYWLKSGEKKAGIKLRAVSESSGRRHSSWLNMMQSRLLQARNLLADDGVMLMSIGSDEEHNLRKLGDEIFGEENFIAKMIWAGGRKNDSKLISVSHEYILVYAKNKLHLTENKVIWRQRKKGIDDIYAQYKKLKKKHGHDTTMIQEDLKAWFSDLDDGVPAKRHKHYSAVDKKGVYFPADISWPGGGGPKYDVMHPLTKKNCSIPNRGWMFADPKKMQEAIDDDRVHFGDDETSVPCIKLYLEDSEYEVPYSVFYQDGRAATKRLRKLMGADYFEHPKNELVLQDLIEAISYKSRDGIFMDFFAGSGTFAHSVLLQNAADNGTRRYVLVQIPEAIDSSTKTGPAALKAGYQKISDITIDRVRRAAQQVQEDHPKANLDLGFRVLELSASNFPQNTFTPDPAKSEEENLKALDEHLAAAAQKTIFDDGNFGSVVTEIAIKFGFGLFYQTQQLGEEFKRNAVYRIEGNDKGALLCLDEDLHDETIEALKAHGDEQLIVAKVALDTTKKFELHNAFKDNLWVV